MQLKGSKTEKNLLRTFAGESRARNKYCFYAEKAKQEGYDYVATIFEETANNELAHAREVFKRYLGMVKPTAENLKDSAEGEAFETSTLYKEFEKVAREEGFNQIGDFYKEVGEVEENHKDRFDALYKRIEDDMIFKSPVSVKWQCMNCGYIFMGKEAPNICPLCKYPRSYFKLYCQDYK